MGGPDAERRVSVCSGRQVARALRAGGRFAVREALIDRPWAGELARLGGDVVFPVLHGRFGEGGPLQEILEALGRPYVGSDPAASALAMDKMATKRLLAADCVPVLPDCRLDVADACPLDPPVVLKPLDEGSSVDLAICLSPHEIMAARARLHPKRGVIMAERYVKGREVTVGILHGRALLPIEIIPAAAFYDYQAKYHRNDTRYVIDPDLPDGWAAACCRSALVAFDRLGCRDVARVDFMVDESGPWFLELNTMPGFTTHSLLPMAARAQGLRMPELCAGLVEQALAREAWRDPGDRPHGQATPRRRQATFPS